MPRRRCAAGDWWSRRQAARVIQNPYLSIANRALTQLIQLQAEFGLTTSSRTRIAAGGPIPADDPFEQFLAQASRPRPMIDARSMPVANEPAT